MTEWIMYPVFFYEEDNPQNVDFAEKQEGGLVSHMINALRSRIFPTNV